MNYSVNVSRCKLINQVQTNLMAVNIISLNVRGIRDNNKRRSIFDYYRKKCDILCLQETHSDEDISIWQHEWGGKAFASHGTSNSRGVLILFNKSFKGNVVKQFADNDGRIVCCTAQINEQTVVIANIYAPNKDSPNFFETHFKRICNIADHVVVVGDLNVALNPQLDRNTVQKIPSKSAKRILELMEELVLCDIWRIQNPEAKRFSWYRSNPQYHRDDPSCPVIQASRLDYAIISQGLSDQIYNCFYIDGLMTDHSALVLTVDIAQSERGRGYWKMNTSILTEPDFIVKMNTELQRLENQYQNVKHWERWELYKTHIKKFVQGYTKGRTSEQTVAISQLSEYITEQEDKLDVIDTQEYQLLQASKIELESLQMERTKTVMFRSKARWYMEGERNTKYFYRLERARYNAKTCNTLLINNVETTDYKQILEEQRRFYQELYTADPTIKFDIKDTIVDKVDKQSVAAQETQFSLSEMASAIKSMKNGSCPGPDGLPAEYYKMFWKQLQQPLRSAMLDAYDKEILHPSCRKAVINVIPKGDKDPRRLENLRPISLLNTDYKLIEKLIANRVTPELKKLINTDQRGFLPERKIACNIRKILDTVIEAEEEKGIILNCDFLKCFDRIETEAVLRSLEQFGFSQIIVKWVRIMYTAFSAKIQNNGHFSKSLDITRSVRQGGPASNVLFLVVAELLANLIRDDENVSGIFIKDILHFLNQYADDMSVSTTFDEDQLNRILQHFDDFRKSTGFQLSYEKTTVYRIGSLKHSKAELYTEKPLNWSNEPIKVLGVYVDHSSEKTIDLNYTPVLDQAKQIMNTWKARNLSLCGKVNIINTLIGSLFVYKMSTLPNVPESIIKQLEKEFETFLWGGHRPKIPTSTLQADWSQGGMRLVNLRLRDAALKSVWIKTVLAKDYPEDIVYAATQPDLRENIWACNLKAADVCFVTNSTNTFWTDVLKSWCQYHFCTEHECLDNDQIIWANSYIRVQNKPVIWPEILRKGLLSVSQLCDETGFLPHQVVQETYGLSCLQYNQLKTSIPKWIRTRAQTQSPRTDHKFAWFMSSSNTTQFIYNELLTPDANIGKQEEKWKTHIHSFNIKEEVLRLKQTTTVAKHRSFQYRLLLRAVITNIHLKRWKIANSDQCSFCSRGLEDYEHLFLMCEYVAPLWSTVQAVAAKELDDTVVINFENVICNTISEEAGIRASNYLCLITKQYIYRQRCLHNKLCSEELTRLFYQAKNIEKYYAMKDSKMIQFRKKWSCTPESDRTASEQLNAYEHDDLSV